MLTRESKKNNHSLPSLVCLDFLGEVQPEFNLTVVNVIGYIHQTENYFFLQIIQGHEC